ncbi:hypothetical protein HMPREF3033_01783 [Veillonellaceae bacterium DNF00751]|nr:hypothetical protein HMPREF3033_01783 [Veillonellaceae bacterium DNF00751]
MCFISIRTSFINDVLNYSLPTPADGFHDFPHPTVPNFRTATAPLHKKRTAP